MPGHHETAAGDKIPPLFFTREVSLPAGQPPGIRVGHGSDSASAGPASYVTQVELHSSAEKARILAGDLIVKINGDNVTGLSAQEVQHRLTGELTLELRSSAVAILQHEPHNLIKTREGKMYTRPYHINAQATRLYWKSRSKKGINASIRLSDIKEIREGRETSSFERSYRMVSSADKQTLGGPDATNCFSIIYGEGYETLDLVARDRQTYSAFVLAMQYFVRSNRRFALNEVEEDQNNPRDRWLRDLFEQADTNHDKQLSLHEVKVLLKSLNLHLPDKELKRRFFEADKDKRGEEGYGKLDQKEFAQFYKALTVRPEIGRIMSGGPFGQVSGDEVMRETIDTFDNVTMTPEQLQLFLRHQQLEVKSVDECKAIIRDFEPAHKDVLGVEGFVRYLRSNAGDAFDTDKSGTVYQDMSQPLSSYFINSSHNTYLTDDQVMGPSDVEAYVRALLNGCRCVEIDCWDGDNEVDGVVEPVVFHGHTLTSKILFKDVCATIAKYAFEASQYPIILSIENHCSPEQQKLLVKHIKDTMGEWLHVIDHNVSKLPSPEDLKGKILIKGKRMKPNFNIEGSNAEDAGTTEDDDLDDEALSKQPRAVRKKLKEAAKAEKKSHSKAVPELAAIISFMGTKFKESHFQMDDTEESMGSNIKELAPVVMSSFVEAKAMNLCTTEGLANEFIKRNCRQLARIYPAGTRIKSSNYDPQPMWNAGAQIVALNFQTVCHEMSLYLGKFRDNGFCGYLLKPEELRNPDTTFDPNTLLTIDPKHRRALSIKVISAQQLPKPNQQRRGEIIDAHVRVHISGIPADCAEARTKTISDNGFNPQWDEMMEFDIHYPPLACVHFRIYDTDLGYDDLVAEAVIPFDSLREGYRHVHLRTPAFNPIRNSSLFIYVSKTAEVRSTKRRSSGQLASVTMLDPAARISPSGYTKIPELDDGYERVYECMDRLDQLREDVLVAVEHFKETVGIDASAHFGHALQLLSERVTKAGGSIHVESADSFCQLNEEGLAPEQFKKPEISSPLRAFASLQKAAEAFNEKFPPELNTIQLIMERFEKVKSKTAWNHALQSCAITKASDKRKARQAFDAKLFRMREAIHNVSQTKQLLNSLRSQAEGMFRSDKVIRVSPSAAAATVETSSAAAEEDDDGREEEML